AFTWAAGNIAGLDERGAHVEPRRRPPDDGPHGLDIGVPAAPGAAVRVRDLVAETRLLAADVADGSHGIAPWVGGMVGARRGRGLAGRSSKDIRPARRGANRRRPGPPRRPGPTV